MNHNIPVIAMLVVLVLLSAYFSAAETAFSSLNKMRVKALAEKGNQRAASIHKLFKNYDHLLSTILIGRTLVNVSAAALAVILFTRSFGAAGLAVSIVVMTVLILLFGKIAPKSMAKEAPEGFAMFSAPALRLLMLFFSPLNFLFSKWKAGLSHLLKATAAPGISEEDLLTIVDEAQEGGGINAQEGQLIRSAIEFNDLKAIEILTPRVDVVTVSDTASNEEIAARFVDTDYSRIPVYKKTIDNVIGILHQKDFYNYVLYGDRPLASVLKPAMFVSPSIPISKLLSLLQQTKSHMAILIDEFGGMAGIVTMEDILEELVGEIWDEHDDVIEPFKKISDHDYKVLCNTNLDKMFDFFGVEDETHATTVSGWVIERLGKIPKEGDCFPHDHLTVTVSKIRSRRILEIAVNVKADAPAAILG